MDRARRQQAGGGPPGKAGEDKEGRRLVFRPHLHPETGSVKEYFRREDAIAERDRLNAEKTEGPDRYVVARVVLAEEIDDGPASASE